MALAIGASGDYEVRPWWSSELRLEVGASVLGLLFVRIGCWNSLIR